MHKKRIYLQSKLLTMRMFAFLFIALSMSNSYAQNIWTKSDRNNLYEDVLADLGKYKVLTNEQRESIGLCCLESITSKYSKETYLSKIEIEVKRIKSSTIDQCSKNIGVELKVLDENPEPQETIIPNSNEWTKEDKSNLVKHSMTQMENLKISEADKETIALCYVDQTCSNKTKDEYNNMIKLELDRYSKSTIEKCANKNNIDLNGEPQVEQKNTSFNKSYLIGTWNTDQGFNITFNEDGTFIKIFKSDIWVASRYTKIENSKVTGDWFIDESGNITLNENWIELEYKLTKTKRYSYTETSSYNLVSNTEDYFKIRFSSGSYCCQESGGSPLQTIQANRSK